MHISPALKAIKGLVSFGATLATFPPWFPMSFKTGLLQEVFAFPATVHATFKLLAEAWQWNGIHGMAFIAAGTSADAQVFQSLRQSLPKLLMGRFDAYQLTLCTKSSLIFSIEPAPSFGVLHDVLQAKSLTRRGCYLIQKLCTQT